MRVGSLGRKDPLEEEMATPSSVLAWKIPWGFSEGRGKEQPARPRTGLFSAGRAFLTAVLFPAELPTA